MGPTRKIPIAPYCQWLAGVMAYERLTISPPATRTASGSSGVEPSPLTRHAGNPEAPRRVDTLADSDSGANERRQRWFRSIVDNRHDRTRLREVRPIMVEIDGESLAELSRPVGKFPVGSAVPTGPYRFYPVHRNDGSKEQRLTNSITGRDDIGAMMKSIAEIHVEPPRRAEHNPIAGRRTYEGVAGGIFLGVRLDLDDPPGNNLVACNPRHEHLVEQFAADDWCIAFKPSLGEHRTQRFTNRGHRQRLRRDRSVASMAL